MHERKPILPYTTILFSKFTKNLAGNLNSDAFLHKSFIKSIAYSMRRQKFHLFCTLNKIHLHKNHIVALSASIILSSFYFWSVFSRFRGRWAETFFRSEKSKNNDLIYSVLLCFQIMFFSSFFYNVLHNNFFIETKPDFLVRTGIRRTFVERMERRYCFQSIDNRRF